MDILSGTGLRIDSAMLASTSSSSRTNEHSLHGLKSSHSCKSICFKALKIFPKQQQSRRVLKIFVSVQEISKLDGSPGNGTKYEETETAGSALGGFVTKFEGTETSGSSLEGSAEALGEETKISTCSGYETKPSFSAVLLAIASMALAAENQRFHEQIGRKMEVPVDTLRQGRLLESGRVYRQTFVIRSYEVGVAKTASVETLMNHFQETALNHVWMSGLAGNGFGATHNMIQHNLIWVVTRMQVQVERYPAWGEVVEIDTWVLASGKNGMRRDWLIRDYKTGQILARATSTWVMMNQKTRRLSKIPDEVRCEIAPYFLPRSALINECSQKILKLEDTAEYARSGLTPRRSDLDMNQHVNNVKYIGWMLESLPSPILDGHELTSMTLEYRRECGQSDVVQSMTSPESAVSPATAESSTAHFSYSSGALALTPEINSSPSIGLQYTHLLRLQVDGAEIVRGRTVWRLKQHLP